MNIKQKLKEFNQRAAIFSQENTGGLRYDQALRLDNEGGSLSRLDPYGLNAGRNGSGDRTIRPRGYLSDELRKEAKRLVRKEAQIRRDGGFWKSGVLVAPK